MRVFYAGLRYNNYDPRRGESFEHQNFYSALSAMDGVRTTHMPFDRIPEIGRRSWNRELWEAVSREKPDVLFVFMYTDELDPETLDRIRRETKTKIVAWFADDYWRFWNYSRDYPPHVDRVVTTSPQAVSWYRDAGFTNVIKSQWACNTAAYAPRDLPQDIAVSFVGQQKPSRARIVDSLARSGIMVEAYGSGWPRGRVSKDGMLSIFSRSKISLNLNDRPSLADPRVLSRLFFRRSMARIVPDLHFARNFRAWRHFGIPHTHARPFELAGCRAFVLSGYSEGIEEYYAEGKEMAFYRSPDELADKIRYYLSHDTERERIAAAAYERTLREHTYERRFREIFKTMELV